MRMDTQQIGIIGKHILIAHLIAADLEVAEPIRDHGIDLIVFRDDMKNGTFVARPIQLKTATHEAFELYSKYARFPTLRIVYVWNAKDPANAQIFVLTYQDALAVLREMKYDKTKAWRGGKHYVTTGPSKKLKKILDEFRVNSPEEWPGRLGLQDQGISS